MMDFQRISYVPGKMIVGIPPGRGRGRGYKIAMGVPGNGGMFKNDFRPRAPEITPNPPLSNASVPVHPPMSEDSVENSRASSRDEASDGASKIKTPMCLVNELARHNKVSHQYHLTDETGPPHKRTFTVTLKLGNEEYKASGPSIKKSQHAAASQALKETCYPHPPPKQKSCAAKNSNTVNCLTPTVELNALAMKRGQRPKYLRLPRVPLLGTHPPAQPYLMHRVLTDGCQGRFGPPAMTYPSSIKPENYNGFNRGPYHPSSQRYMRRPPCLQPMLLRVCLTLGDDLRFQGVGQTAQLARHDAAAKALAYYKNFPVGESGDKSDQPDGSVSSDLDVSDGENKSRISLLYEVALKRGLTLDFKVVSETGPPHLRTFVTQCTLGEFMTEGEGSGKKLSKKKAAEKMLEELKKNNMLYPPTHVPGSKLKTKTVLPKKKPKNLVKDTTPVHSEESALAMDPVSRLMQLQQARKGREPVFVLISDKGNPRKPEFVVQVSVDQKSCIGTGAKKKLAKKAAAQKMLEKLLASENGRSCASDVPESSSPKSINQLADALQELNLSTMSDTSENLGCNQQPVPGVLVMPKTFKNENGVKPLSAPPVTQAPPTSVPSMGVRPEIQLKYLAEIEGFTVHYEDFPKSNRSVYLSLVTVSTNPPQVRHGVGATLEESRDQAAKCILKFLAEVGLDSMDADSQNQALAE